MKTHNVQPIMHNDRQKSVTFLRYTSRGFTLLEAMVAIAIFTVIMVVGISALLNVSNTHKKAQNMRSIIDTVSYLMEDMARNIRLGSDYYCIPGNGNLDLVTAGATGANSCTPDTMGGFGALALAIEPQEGTPYDPGGGEHNLDDQVVYEIATRNGSSENCELKKSTNGGIVGSFISVTPQEVEFHCTASGFNVYGPTTTGGANLDPDEPSRVIIRLTGIVRYKDTTTPLNVQTTVTQRALNKTTP